MISDKPLSPLPEMAVPVLRVARASIDLERLLPFYRDGLGMTVLSRFTAHAGGYDGVILGWPRAPYHLEFTRQHDGPAPARGDGEDLLAFYITDAMLWQSRVERMQACGYAPVAPANPWWGEHGLTFEDADGYRVVLVRAGWSR